MQQPPLSSSIVPTEFVGTVKEYKQGCEAKVFALATANRGYDREIIFINMAGPTSSVDAIWANLVARERVGFDPADKGRAFRLVSAKHDGLSGKEVSFKRAANTRLPATDEQNVILLDRRVYEPPYQGGYTFVFDGPQLARCVGYHIQHTVREAVFSPWYQKLLDLGQQNRLVTAIPAWGISVFQVELNPNKWRNLISTALAAGDLRLPGVQYTVAAPPGPLAKSSPGSPGEEQTAKTVSDQSETVSPSSEKPADATPVAEQPAAPSADQPPEPQTSADALEAATATVRHDGDWTWVYFEDKPSDAITARLREAGFRWSRKRQAWYTTTHLPADGVGGVSEVLEITAVLAEEKPAE